MTLTKSERNRVRRKTYATMKKRAFELICPSENTACTIRAENVIQV